MAEPTNRQRDIELKASELVVPGFPELKQNRQCRLCAYALDTPHITSKVHELWRQGSAYRVIEDAIQGDLKEAGYSPVNFGAIRRHLLGHVARHLIPNRTEAAAGRPPYAARPPAMTDDEADYFELRKLYDRLIPIVDLVKRDQDRKVESGEPLSGYDLQHLVRLFGECRMQLEALNKMRNSNRLTKAVIEAHTSQVLMLLSEPLGHKLRDIRHRLKVGLMHDAMRDLDALIDAELPPMLVSSGKEAIRRSVEEYKLH